MDRKKRKKSNAGMSLLEVIVAVSIFSITAAVLLQSFVTSQRINKKSNLYLEATTVAQNIMEEIIKMYVSTILWMGRIHQR